MNIELLTIYTLSADGTSYARFLVDGAPVELLDYSYVTERMGATSLTATVRHAKCLDTLWTGREFVVLDEGALVEGGVSAVEKFFLAHTPSSRKDNTDARYEHTLEFRAERDILLSGVYFCDAVNPSAASAGKPVSNSYEVRFVGTLDEFVQRFNDVLAHRGLSGRFSVSLEAGVQGTTESLEIQFDKVTLADALQQAVETWKVPFYFLGDSAVFGSADSMPLVDVEYGADDELLSVAMTNRNEKRVTRISGVGSSDNVPYYYPNPSPKGTLGLGGTFAEGAQIADMVKFAQRVGAADTLTYMGDEPSLSMLRVLFGGQVGENAPGGVTAGVEDVTMESGKELPLLVSLNADLSGGFERRISIPLYANVGCMEQVDPEELVYHVTSYDPTASYGGTYRYVTRKGGDVALYGWDIVVDRVEMAFGSGAQPLFLQVPYAEEYASRDVAPEDRDLYSAQTLSAVVVDVAEALKLFSNPDTAHCRIYVYAHVASRVKWQKRTGVTGILFAPAQFLAQRVEATTVFDASGWYNGDEPLGADLSEVGLRVTGTPHEGDTLTQAVLGYVTPTGRIMPSIYRDTSGAQRTYDADNTPPTAYAQAYVNPDTGQNYVFEHEYDAREPHEHVEEYDDVKPTIANLQDGQGHALNVLDSVWFDDGYNVRDLLADGQTLKYQYFFVKLKALGFNLFDCAIENGEMALVMSDGPCAGCHFKILVTEDGKNPVQRNANGTLKKEGASGHQKGVIDAGNIQAAQQDTTANAVWVALYLDDQTFGGGEYGTMPAYDKNTNSGPKPAAGDSYTAENILLPQAFFTAAEQELDRRIVRFMWENNADKFDPTVGFSRIYLAENPTVRAGLCDHSRLRLSYAGRTFSPLYVSQFTLNVKEGEPLPEVLVTTKDVVEPRTAGLDERIAAAAEAAVNVVLPAAGGSLSQEDADKRYLRKDKEDTSPALTTFQRGINIGDYRAGLGGIGGTIYTNAAGEAVAEVDFLNVRRKATFTQVEIEALRKVSGTILLSLAEATLTAVEEVSGGWKCWFKTDAVDGSAIANGFAAGDQAICRTLQGNRDHYYWRLVTEVGTDYIVLSASDADNGSDAPEVGDAVVQLGNRTDASRQGAQILSCYGEDSPSHVSYAGINSYVLAGKEISGFVYRETSAGSGVYKPFFFNYGPMTLGDRQDAASRRDYVDYDPTTGTLTIKGTVVFKPGQQIPGLEDYEYLKTALPLDEDATLIQGGLILSKTIALTDANGNILSGINGLPSLSSIAAWYGGPMVDHEALPAAASYAKSLFRFDGSGYLAGGNIHWDDDGYGGIPGVTWSREGGQDVVTIGGNVRLASVSGDTVTDLITAIQLLPTTYVDFVSNQTITGVKTFTNGIKIGDATLTWVPASGNTAGYLHIDSALVTAGDQIVIDGEPGGGGGGGVMYLSELLDVSLANLAGGQVLSYDSTAQVWKNRALGAAADYGVTNVVTAGDTTHLVTGAAVATAVAAVLKWKGITTTDIAANPSANPIIINGQSYTAVMGDVVVLSGTSTEYLYNGSTWEPMGDEASYALKTVTITGTGYLTGGGTLEANRTLDIASSVKTKIDNGAAAYGYFSGGVLGTSHLPALYLGTTRIQTASAEQDVTGVGNLTMGWNKYLYMLDENGTAKEFARFYKSSTTTIMRFGGGNTGATNMTLLLGGSELRFQTGRSAASTHLSLTENASGSKSARLYGNLVMNNAAALYFYNYPAEGAQAQSFRAVYATTGNILYFGDGTIGKDYQTRVYGSPLAFYTGSSSVTAANRLTITADGIIRPYVDIVPNTNNAIDLGSSTRFFAEAYATKVYLSSSVYLEYVDNSGNGYVHINAPLVTDGDQIVVSGTPGGGGGGGSQYLWELLDVDDALITPSNGVVLQYNATAEKWVGVASDTIGITTAGTVAELNAASPTTAKRVWSPSVLASWLAGKNYVENVAIGTGANAEKLTVTRGGSTSYLTVPYATNVVRFKRYEGVEESEGYDLNTLLSGGGITSQYGSMYYWANAPANMSFGGAVQVNAQASNSLAMQLAWDVVHNRTQGIYQTGKLWWRDATYHDGAAAWGAWHLIYDDTTLTKSVVTGLLDAGNGTYLPLSGGTMSGDIIIPSGKYIRLNASTAMLGLSSGGVFYCGPGDSAASFLLRSGNVNLIHRKYTAASTYNDYAILDASIAYISSSAVTMGSNTVGSSDSPIGYATQAKRPFAVTPTQEAGAIDLNTILAGGGATRNVWNKNYWAHAPSGATYFGMAYQINPTSVETGAMQFFWDGTYTGATPTGGLFWRLRNNTGWADDWHRIYDSANANLSTVDWACKDLNAAGKVNVGAPSSTTATVNVAGTIWASNGIWSDADVSAGGLSSSSDARLKANIKDFKYTPELLMSLRPREWDWNGKTPMNGHAAGFVAQEVEPILPYAVRERDYKQMVYNTFDAVAISGLQDHETRIRALERENKEIKKENKELKKLLKLR
ncbi:MAG: tail fiber domain-containing protein [Lachnospiraceae bacterium]|nr:tail fiber domain-containing protein [Lachnospiraceae bacterium]